MNARNPREDLNKAFPTKPIPEGLPMNIQAVLSVTQQPHRIFNPKLVATLATAVCGIAIAFLVFSPQKASASLLQVMNRIDGTKTAHFQFFNDKNLLTREMYYGEGKWRFSEGTKVSEVYDNGWAYKTKSDFGIMVKRKADSPFGTPITSFKISSILTPKMNETAQIETGIDDQGRTANRYTISDGREQTVFYVDPKTELPYRSDLSFMGKNGWTKRGSVKMEFDAGVDEKTFYINVTDARKVINHDEAHAAWIKKLSSSNLGEVDITGGECIIRNVQVSESGDVFVLYTATGFPEGRLMDPLGVQDDQGNVYVPMSESFFHGEKLSPDLELHWAWFTPASSVSSWSPRTITINAYRSADHRLVDRLQCTYRVTKPIPKGVKMVTQDMMTPTYEGIAAKIYSAKIAEPQCKIVPDYVHYCGVVINTLSQIELNQHRTRAMYWTEKGDWALGEQEWRAALETLERNETESGQSWAKLSEYDGLAKCLDKLGRTDEAADYRKQADIWRNPRQTAPPDRVERVETR